MAGPGEEMTLDRLAKVPKSLLSLASGKIVGGAVLLKRERQDGSPDLVRLANRPDARVAGVCNDRSDTRVRKDRERHLRPERQTEHAHTVASCVGRLRGDVTIGSQSCLGRVSSARPAPFRRYPRSSSSCRCTAPAPSPSRWHR